VIKIPNNNVVDAQACSAELTELESMTEDQVKSLIRLTPACPRPVFETLFQHQYWKIAWTSCSLF